MEPSNQENKETLDSSKLSPTPKKSDDVIENYVALLHVNKFYDKDVQAVKDFNLEIAQYEFVAFKKLIDNSVNLFTYFKRFLFFRQKVVTIFIKSNGFVN